MKDIANAWCFINIVVGLCLVLYAVVAVPILCITEIGTLFTLTGYFIIGCLYMGVSFGLWFVFAVLVYGRT